MKKSIFTFAFIAVAAISANATVSPTWTMGFPWKTTGAISVDKTTGAIAAEKDYGPMLKTTGAISLDKTTGFDELLGL